MSTTTADLTAALNGLLEKYGKPPLPPPAPQEFRVALDAAGVTAGGASTFVPGSAIPGEESPENLLPLLPWRHERRFIELKRLVDDHVVDPVLMCRFSCTSDGEAWPLEAILYREFDLAEWLTGTRIESMQASFGEGTSQQPRYANVVLQVTGGAVCGLEVATTLPLATAMVDRHELIARRGVACDRVVDTQVPQQSIYAYTDDGEARYTDTDAELFGLEADEVNLVRAAYATLAGAHGAEGLLRRHRRLVRLVRLAAESDRQCRRFVVDEGGNAR